MSLKQNRWFRRFGLGAVAALSLGAAVIATVPAQAHEYGYQAPVFVNPASFFPRFFFGFGGEQHWDHQNYRDQHWR